MKQPAKLGWGMWVKRRSSFLGLKLGFVAESAGTTPRNFSRWLTRETMPALDASRRAGLAKVLRVDEVLLPHAHVLYDPTTPTWISEEAQPRKLIRKVFSGEEADSLVGADQIEAVYVRLRYEIIRLAGRLSGQRLQQLHQQALRLAQDAGVVVETENGELVLSSYELDEEGKLKKLKLTDLG